MISISKAANALSIKIGTMTITVYRHSRTRRLFLMYGEYDGYNHIQFGWGHPKYHARWARNIVIYWT